MSIDHALSFSAVETLFTLNLLLAQRSPQPTRNDAKDVRRVGQELPQPCEHGNRFFIKSRLSGLRKGSGGCPATARCLTSNIRWFEDWPAFMRVL